MAQVCGLGPMVGGRLVLFCNSSREPGVRRYAPVIGEC